MDPRVGILMGSDSDLEIMEEAAQVCEEFGVTYEIHVLSAHRTPQDTADYARHAHQRGLKVIIAGAGGAAHLAGVVAAHTPLPVIGVPIKSKALKGHDSLLSTVQMPAGVPVATVAINGGHNAGLLAVQILATHDADLFARLVAYKEQLAEATREKDRRLQERLRHKKH
ncbi:MAG: 5-(carboxyamino)imidazole ribonucleotide mutase [Deltaproteobacteria bacterium]|nr:MAG: 5-(carboxyamino)imidazole ribonucleotide mutase [Deltaproteobacteria bacterium]